jgi:hypothetical protein
VQRVVDDLLHARLLELLTLVGLRPAQLHVAERDEIAEIRLALRRCFQGLGAAGCAGVAFEMNGAIERGGVRPGGVAEVLVEVAEGFGRSEVRVGNAVASELVDAFEELVER